MESVIVIVDAKPKSGKQVVRKWRRVKNRE